MAFLAPIAIAASLGSAAVGAYGAYQTGQAEKQAALYNAAVSQQNATLAKENANIAQASGNQQASISEMKTRATSGAIKANEAASGIDVNSGSAPDVRASASEIGELDALTVRSNATREAYGYTTQAHSFETQSNLDKFEAANDSTAGLIGAGSTFLGGVGNAANMFAKYQMQGGFSG
jgi:hypothetical protein